MAPRTQLKKSTTEIARSVWLGTFLLSGFDVAAAARASGLTDPRTPEKLGHLLLETHGLADRPRSGRQRKYTDDTCDAAQEHVVSSPSPYYSNRNLVADLRRSGKAPPKSNDRCFQRALRGHLQQKGLKLLYGQRSRPFSIVSSQAKKRLDWCVKHLPDFLTEEQLRQYTFEDETTVEESPHPKGKPGA